RARRLVGAASDITADKEREGELHSARVAVAEANRDVEQTREVMQTVLDNMNDGVLLFGKGLQLKFSNTRQLQNETSKGYSLPGIIGSEVERGQFGAVADMESKIKETLAQVQRPGGSRYEQPTADGRVVEYNFTPLAEGSLLVVCSDVTERTRYE